MAYRDQKKALEERIAALETQLAATASERQRVEQDLAQARRELAALAPATEPAPPPVAARGRLVVAGLVLLGGLLCAILWRPDSEAPPPAAQVPLGLKGLRFGITPAAAKQVVGRIEPLPAEERCAREARNKGGTNGVRSLFADVEAKLKCERQLRQWLALEDEQRMPGPRRVLETLLFEEPARCYLSFAVAGGLSRIACRIDPPQHKVREVYSAITSQMESRWRGAEPDGPKSDRHSWRNPEATLEARLSITDRTYDNLMPAPLRVPPDDHITITNTWARHEEARRAAVARAQEARRRDEAARQTAAERQAERERQLRIERLKRLESRPPEAPQAGPPPRSTP